MLTSICVSDNSRRQLLVTIFKTLQRESSKEIQMNLKHLQTVISPNTDNGADRISSVCWSPNNLKLAVCGKEKVVYLYNDHGEIKDKFPTRPCDPKYGIASYIVTCLVFSPDSTKIAVGQSDNIVYIYKLGEDFGKQKKSITNKFPQPASVVAMIWPNELEFICGLIDGKLRHTPVLPTKTKSKTFFNPESPNIALVSSPNGTEVGAGFADGRIALFVMEDSETPTLLATIHHPCAPFALAWGTESILAGGCDKKIQVYDRSGKVKQYFDYTREEKDHEFSVACTSPSGQCVIFGTFNRLRLYQWSAKRRAWEEASVKDFQNFYTMTAMSWRKDGTRVALATLPGGLHYFESILRRSKNSKFEVTYITPSHAIMKMTGSKLEANMKSKYSGEIVDVRLMGKDKYALAQTMETLIICDIERSLVSEIPWSSTDDKEKFYFDNPNCCMIFNDGEMILVEYGRDEILGTFRTELVNPHVISVRINERIPKQNEETPNNKKLAFLLDLKTIAIVDLEYSLSLGHIVHDSKIDWLELNELAHKLLFRDRRMRLMLVDVDTMLKYTILQFCNFVQWVPQSDVVVAQSKRCIYVWYNIDVPEQCVETEVKGVAFDVLKENGKTAVLIQDGNAIHEFNLDESRIEFGTAIDDGDFVRAMAFLESVEPSSDTESMWKILGKVTLDARELLIAERALCALGDIARAKFVRDTLTVAMRVEAEGLADPGEGSHCHEVQARLAILDGQLKLAEAIFLDNNDVESAISMYEAMHRWEDAIGLAQVKAHPYLKKLIDDYLGFLTSSGQYELAAEFLERNGNPVYAVQLYLEGGLPTKAAKLVITNPNMSLEQETLNQISTGLFNGDFFEESGDFFDATGNQSRALECFKKAKSYDKAIRLAKGSFPNEVVPLEEEWGDYLSSNRQHDAATNHYIEAGRLTKALDAAIESRQWKKALQIIEAIDDTEGVAKQYMKIGAYYESANDYHLAEKCYSNSGVPTRAVDMYSKKGMWEDAHRVATTSVRGRDELTQKYVAEANEFQKQGKFAQAEKLYIAVGQQDLAISMYGAEKLFDDMLRLVQIYHPEHMNDSHKHVADIMQENDNLKGAEQHYLKANNFQAVLDMYQEKGLWEDAYRVARSNGGGKAGRLVIFEWANSLGGETAVRLLKKFGQLDNCIDFCCENNNFGFALEIATIGSKESLQGIHLRYGKYLETQGKLEEAEAQYISADEPKEAIEMYIRQNQVQQAVDVASTHVKEELPRVLLIHAQILFEERKYPQFETVILRAEKPELAIELYKRKGMWTEAFKLCKEYAPQNLKKLQSDYDEKSLGPNVHIDPLAVITQAKEFERLTEYKRAIDCYLSLNKTNLGHDLNILEKCWTKAGELATKFLPMEPCKQYVTKIGPLLISLKSYHNAAVFYLDTNLQQDALDALIGGELWADAKAASKEMGPKWEEYVRRRHTDFLKNAGQVEQLEDVNFVAALDLLCEQGHWKKCLERAKKNEGLLHHYAGRYVYHLLKQKLPVEAMYIYIQHGVPANKHHYPLYRGISEMIFMDPKLDTFENWMNLRNLLFQLIGSITETPDCGGHSHVEFEHFLIIVHYYCNRAAFQEVPGLETLSTKCSVALLRHSDVIPVDRAFYEAGIACKKISWDSMAFVFLNHYLDVHDAMEEGAVSTEMLDNSDLKNTDIPLNVSMPSTGSVLDDAHDEVKEWVLAASMDRSIAQELRLDERGLYEASLLNTHQQRIEDACLVTGYPALGSRVTFRVPNKVANKEDWNKLFMTAKSGQYPRVTDVLEFITRWCGSNPNYSL